MRLTPVPSEIKTRWPLPRPQGPKRGGPLRRPRLHRAHVRAPPLWGGRGGSASRTTAKTGREPGQFRETTTDAVSKVREVRKATDRQSGTRKLVPRNPLDVRVRSLGPSGRFKFTFLPTNFFGPACLLRVHFCHQPFVVVIENPFNFVSFLIDQPHIGSVW